MFKLAQRYEGQINTWVIWNEPDLYSDQIMYTWDGTVNDLYQLVKVASLAVKKANPDAKIALPGLTYWWDKAGGRPLYLARFLEAASHDPTAAAHGDYFDIVTLHQYTNPLNTYVALARLSARAESVRLAATDLGRRIERRAQRRSVRADRPGLSRHDGSAGQLRHPVVRAGPRRRRRAHEHLQTDDERPEGPGELYGLVRNDGSVRPAFTAFQTAVR